MSVVVVVCCCCCLVVVVAVQDKRTCIVKHITMIDVQFIYFAFFPLYTFTGPKIDPPLRCRQGNHKLCSVHEPTDNPGRVASVQEGTQLNLDDHVKLLFCMYYHFSVNIPLKYGMAQCG